MKTNAFFDHARLQSQVKSKIVSDYFPVWATIIKGGARDGRIAYVELFAGTGRYKDGTASTPLKVLGKAIADPKLRDIVVSIFVEKNMSYCTLLQTSIDHLPEIGLLKHSPQVYHKEVDAELTHLFERMRLIPSLVFVDPFGYKGLRLDLIKSVVKDWACECVFLFNYNRISTSLTNDLVNEHMDALFGQVRADSLRKNLPGMKRRDKEKVILSALREALHEAYGRYVLFFRFEMERSNRTSHYVVHVTKHSKGYERMKEIMARESTSCPQGVPSFEYSAAQIRQPMLFHTSSPLDDLKKVLLTDFRGRRKMMKVLVDEHNIGTPYIRANYKEALLQLEQEGLVEIDRPQKKPGTLGDKAIVRFLG